MNRFIALCALCVGLVATPAVSHTLVLDTRTSPAIAAFAHDGKIDPILGARITAAFGVAPSGIVSEITPIRSESTATIALPSNTRAAIVRYMFPVSTYGTEMGL